MIEFLIYEIVFYRLVILILVFYLKVIFLLRCEKNLINFWEEVLSGKIFVLFEYYCLYY